ncbi:MAG: hypothetical protein GY804_03125 [Alphaproteobacteria bacterium]|nr:hypothetical protein [Alphaproteobacteria bacterium]
MMDGRDGDRGKADVTAQDQLPEEVADSVKKCVLQIKQVQEGGGAEEKLGSIFEAYEKFFENGVEALGGDASEEDASEEERFSRLVYKEAKNQNVPGVVWDIFANYIGQRREGK